MEPLRKAFPESASQFEFFGSHEDGVTTYQHKDTGGKLHIDGEGQTRDRYGEAISPQKALEAATNPVREKSNGLGKSNDSGSGFSM